MNTDVANKWNITTVNDYRIISILDAQVKANTAASLFSLFESLKVRVDHTYLFKKKKQPLKFAKATTLHMR